MGNLTNEDIAWDWLYHMLERARVEGTSFGFDVGAEVEELPPENGWRRYRDTGKRTLTVKVG